MSRAKERKAAAARHRQKIAKRANNETRQNLQAQREKIDEKRRKQRESQQDSFEQTLFEELFRMIFPGSKFTKKCGTTDMVQLAMKSEL